MKNFFIKNLFLLLFIISCKDNKEHNQKIIQKYEKQIKDLKIEIENNKIDQEEEKLNYLYNPKILSSEEKIERKRKAMARLKFGPGILEKIEKEGKEGKLKFLFGCGQSGDCEKEPKHSNYITVDPRFEIQPDITGTMQDVLEVLDSNSCLEILTECIPTTIFSFYIYRLIADKLSPKGFFANLIEENCICVPVHDRIKLNYSGVWFFDVMSLSGHSFISRNEHHIKALGLVVHINEENYNKNKIEYHNPIFNCELYFRKLQK